MDIYSPDTPAMRKDRIIRAYTASKVCTGCGERFDKSNLIALKDGRMLCTGCHDAFLDHVFGEGS